MRVSETKSMLKVWAVWPNSALSSQMQISEIESKYFIVFALNLREGWHAQFSYILSLGCGLRSGTPGEGHIDGRAISTVKRECSSFSFGLPFFTFNCEDKPLVVGVWIGWLNEICFASLLTLGYLCLRTGYRKTGLII